jgi:chemotaxis protein MotB
MARRREQEAELNQDRWLVSYADFITLLFAFFVVMYAVSSVNEGKYRVLSDSLITAFNKSSPTTLEPIQVGKIKRSGEPQAIELIKKPSVIDLSTMPKPASRKDGEKQDPMHILLDALRVSIASLADQGMVKVNSDDNGIEVEISTNILFGSGSATLSPQATPILQSLAHVLRVYPNEINVQGYTDNIPIRSNLFPSNWELSAARAASVVQLFMQEGVDPLRLSATGYGEFRPVADNATEQGRQRNRRVVLFIPTVKDKQKISDALSRMGDRLRRANTMDQPAGLEPVEGIRTEINRIGEREYVPVEENPVTTGGLFSTQTSQQRTTPDTATNSPVTTGGPTTTIVPGTGQRHIANQPIEGTVVPLNKENGTR